MFSDIGLQETTGRFLLQSLNTEDARAMLEAQTAALVSATVLDEGVQRNTSEAMTTSVWYVEESL